MTMVLPLVRTTVPVRSTTALSSQRLRLFVLGWLVACGIILVTYRRPWWTRTAPPPRPAQLLSVPRDGDTDIACTITTDVRGNLGPADVMLTNGSNWMTDRWQAASDLHGTNIQGPHWVQLEWHASSSSRSVRMPVRQMTISHLILDWEAAYADDYTIQVQSTHLDTTTSVHTLVTPPLPFVDPTVHNASARTEQQQATMVRVVSTGQSPGVDSVTPLHVLHEISFPPVTVPLPGASLRLTIHTSATGWGVSLWQIQVYGWYD